MTLRNEFIDDLIERRYELVGIQSWAKSSMHLRAHSGIASVNFLPVRGHFSFPFLNGRIVGIVNSGQGEPGIRRRDVRHPELLQSLARRLRKASSGVAPSALSGNGFPVLAQKPLLATGSMSTGISWRFLHCFQSGVSVARELHGLFGETSWRSRRSATATGDARSKPELLA